MIVIPEIKEYEYRDGQRGQWHSVSPFVDHVHLVPQLENNNNKSNNNKTRVRASAKDQ